MSHLQRSVAISCPATQAVARLRNVFKEQGNVDGDVLKLELHFYVKLPGLETPLAFSCPVLATVRTKYLAAAAAEIKSRFSVQWAATNNGPYPLFTGELYVADGEGLEPTTLGLTGTYAPPFGLPGKGFDTILGHRIAEETATNLLLSFKERIERGFQAPAAA